MKSSVDLFLILFLEKVKRRLFLVPLLVEVEHGHLLVHMKSSIDFFLMLLLDKVGYRLIPDTSSKSKSDVDSFQIHLLKTKSVVNLF